jgi:hypothetical protein
VVASDAVEVDGLRVIQLFSDLFQKVECFLELAAIDIVERQHVLVNAIDAGERLLVHREVGYLLKQVQGVLLHAADRGLAVVERREVVTVLDLSVVYLGDVVLLRGLLERLELLKVVRGLLLEDSAELVLGLLEGVERRPLVHAVLANATVASEDDVELPDSVVQQLHAIEYVAAIWTVLQVNLRKVAVPRLLQSTVNFDVDSVRALKPTNLVDRDKLAQLRLVNLLLLLLRGLREVLLGIAVEVVRSGELL